MFRLLLAAAAAVLTGCGGEPSAPTKTPPPASEVFDKKSVPAAPLGPPPKAGPKGT